MTPNPNALTQQDAAELTAFVAGGLTVFRTQAIAGDPEFFKKDENVMVYRELAQNLITVWISTRNSMMEALASMVLPVVQ